jgi:hypothetical protein
MAEMFFFETLMTPGKLHILNPRDSKNHVQVHDMSQCLVSSVVKGIGLSIFFLVDVGFFSQLQCIRTPTWKRAYRSFLINVLYTRICNPHEFHAKCINFILVSSIASIT